MAVALFPNSRNTRPALIVALLLISFVTTGLLALQAYKVSTYQRAAAESVIRDYSSLVADEVVRRSSADLGYYGYYTLVEAVLREAGRPKHTLADLQPAPTSPELRRAAVLAESYFQADSQSGNLAFTSDSSPPEVTAKLRQRIAESASSRKEGPYRVFHLQQARSAFTFVVGTTRSAEGKEITAGFQVDRTAWANWIGVALNRQPLLPPSLGHGKVTNQYVHLIIRDPAGAERLRFGPPVVSDLAVTKPFGDTYQGSFSGFTVEAGLDPQVASEIIIGGLPRSRLPFFLGLLALNAGLLFTAILQLRREMELQRLRNEFVSSVSHELRTPLTQIRMFTETLLLDRIRSTEEHRRCLEIIHREARRLTQLVENVLQFSRSERGTGSLSKSPRELAPVLQRIAEDFEISLEGSQTRTESHLAPGVAAEVDSDALRQIVLNLLDNAVKYGPKRQRIILRLEASNGTAVVSVEDEGPGVPAADRTRIFEQFHRLERDRQSAIAGTGIGLSVVRDLVVRHGGACRVETGQRGGARFVVELPAVALYTAPENSSAEAAS